MKKQIWVAAGIAGMLLGNTPSDARADINVNIGVNSRPPIAIDVWPEFIYVPDLGFSVAEGNQWDIVRYDNYYYVYRDNYWYRASHQRGPWVIVERDRLPDRVRRHSWVDIRRFRDNEYRRHRDSGWRESAERYDFIYIPALGFSVAVGSPWDIVMYDNYYYVYRNNSWYRSSHKRGPWMIVQHDRIPGKIRRHNWVDIRRYRDVEYRKHERSRQFNQGPRIDDRRDNRDERRFDDDRRSEGERRPANYVQVIEKRRSDDKAGNGRNKKEEKQDSRSDKRSRDDNGPDRNDRNRDGNSYDEWRDGYRK
ncbi:hypothetical protein [Chlorobium sp.]|jgi:hypothetical protein|uniref:hypothetical protein n=1 Tax=Chlorobium sp. TaxID=1095 RepID=UPI003C51CE28|nr:hypothetical protein [Chlorobiaceae bacterium]NTW94779.1 hypothetical protein [Chlorobiaceae bacterium]